MAGNVACAVHAAAKLGSCAFGMFIKSQNRLQSPPLTGEEVSAFRNALVVCNGRSISWHICSQQFYVHKAVYSVPFGAFILSDR